MADEQGGLKAFFQTVPGILTAIATFLGAVSALLLALNQFFNALPHPTQSTDTSASSLQTPVAEGAATATSSVIQTEQALLTSFRGCWHADNTEEIVKSKVATGTFSMSGKIIPSPLDFCFKDRDYGTVYFEPSSDGDVVLSEALRQIGVSSKRVQWTAFELDPSNRQITHTMREWSRRQLYLSQHRRSNIR